MQIKWFLLLIQKVGMKSTVLTLPGQAGRSIVEFLLLTLFWARQVSSAISLLFSVTALKATLLFRVWPLMVQLYCRPSPSEEHVTTVSPRGRQRWDNTGSDTGADRSQTQRPYSHVAWSNKTLAILWSFNDLPHNQDGCRMIGKQKRFCTLYLK